MKKNTIRLIGLNWDKENLDGLHDFDSANALAKDAGKRLPTSDELDELYELPNCWDDERRGRWFAETVMNLGYPDRSLFLPATGYRNVATGVLTNVGSYGYYWSGTPYSAAYGYYLYFSAASVSPSYTDNRGYGFAVRCVSE